jgi:hypothetical protein
LVVAGLPHPGVGLGPPVGGPVGQSHEHVPDVVVQIAELVAQDMGGIEHLTENIELHLRPRVVPDSHRPTVAVPGEVVERVLGKIALAFHAVHDLAQLRAYGAGGVRQPV